MLCKSLKRMKNKQVQKLGKEIKEATEYFTDEEELARETQWIKVKGKNCKKRRLDITFTPPQINQTEHVNFDKEKKIKKTKPPPPFIVHQIKNFNELHEQLSSQITSFQIKIISNAAIKINVLVGDSYRLVAKMLERDSPGTPMKINKIDI